MELSEEIVTSATKSFLAVKVSCTLELAVSTKERGSLDASLVSRIRVLIVPSTKGFTIEFRVKVNIGYPVIEVTEEYYIILPEIEHGLGEHVKPVEELYADGRVTIKTELAFSGFDN